MSEFAVTVEEIKGISPHTNADRLELGTLTRMSFQFVVQKGAFKAGDRVVYFPVDSLIPEDLQEILGVKGYLAGSEKNRVKTVKLRGAISQGVVAPIQAIQSYVEKLYGMKDKPVYCGFCHATSPNPVGMDLTSLLKIEKYEPPGIQAEGCTLHPLPGNVSMYDIEGADRYPEVVDLLMDQVVEVTEKLEGTNFWAQLTKSGEFIVGQRRARIESPEDKPHAFQVFADSKVLRFIPDHVLEAFTSAPAQTLREGMERILGPFPDATYITLRGEFLGPGVQGNYYDFKSKTVRFFDLEVDGVNVPKMMFHQILPEESRVPVLSSDKTLREWLDGRTIQEASDGKSVLNNQKLREGVVVTPMYKEQRHPQIGRLFIKQRSPAYLAKTDF